MNLPALRFRDDDGSEFPEWTKATLGDVAKFRRGSFPQPYGLAKWYDDINGMPFIQVFDVDDNFKLKNTTKRKISKEAQLQSVFVKAGSILVTIQGSIGRIAVTQYDAYLDRTLLLFESFKLNINKIYFAYILFLLFEIEKEKAPGGIIKTITKEVLTHFKVSICRYDEQTKIANFLTAVDEKISQLTQKHKLLNQYKKGVMQKIFSQELRFKDDDESEFPDWQLTKIKEISTKESSTISANSIEENTGHYKIYGASGLLKFVDFFISEEPYLAVVKDGSGVGRVFVCDANSSVLGTLQIIKPTDKVHLHFLYNLIQLIDFSKYIAGGAIPHIYYKDYSSESVKLPSIKEQTKIANFLSVIDEKITSTQSQLELVKQYKQGLLQQMFV